MTGPSGTARPGALSLGGDGHESGASVPKLATGIPGFDHVAMGGVPRARATVVAGQAGSAKTVFAGQFLAEGVRAGQPGVFVSLEEPAKDLRANLQTLGFDVAAWEADGQWRFVDASPVVRGTGDLAPYDLDTLVAQIGHAVDATGAERLVLDSLNAVLSLHEDVGLARQLLRALIAKLRGMGLTVVLTVETPGDPGGTLSRYGIEEFVADSVVLLRNVREGTFRRRTVEVLKMRGAMHHKGDVPFTVVPGQGMVVLPVREPEQEVGLDRRLTTGNDAFDTMTGGGSVRRVLHAGHRADRHRQDAARHAVPRRRGTRTARRSCCSPTRRPASRSCATPAGGGATSRSGSATAGCSSSPSTPRSPRSTTTSSRSRPSSTSSDRSRVAVDSLSALERLGSPASYREFVIGLTSFVKETGVAALVTRRRTDLLGGTSVTESHISGLIDSIVLLRYVEVYGEMRRGITVLKMRGQRHDHHPRVHDRPGRHDHGRPVHRRARHPRTGPHQRLTVPPCTDEHLPVRHRRRLRPCG